jgi:hypothetical protein
MGIRMDTADNVLVKTQDFEQGIISFLFLIYLTQFSNSIRYTASNCRLAMNN